MKKLSILVGAAGALLMMGSVATADDSLYITAEGLIGVNNNTPDKQVHVKGTTDGPEALYKLEQPGAKKVRFALANGNGAWTFDMSADAKSFLISKVGTGAILQLTDSGELFIRGSRVFP